MSFILLPVKRFHPITNHHIGTDVAITNVNPSLIKTFKEDESDGTVIVEYFNAPPIYTEFPFLKMLELLTKSNIVSFAFCEIAGYYSENLKGYIDTLKETHPDIGKI